MALSEALLAAAAVAGDGAGDAASIRDAARRALAGRGVEPEYLGLVDPATSACPIRPRDGYSWSWRRASAPPA